MHIRQLADDETVVLVSDLHIGGSGGDEIFASAPELTEFLVELQRTPGPVQLVIVGDFFDVERMGDPSAAREGISHTLSRADYRDLWEAFRQFRQVDGHRVVYLIGNHDVAIWRDRTLQQLLLSNDIVDEIALSYAAQYRSLPGRLVYAEHGNQFDILTYVPRTLSTDFKRHGRLNLDFCQETGIFLADALGYMIHL